MFEVYTGSGAEVCPVILVSLQLIHAGIRQCDKGCRLDSVSIYIIDAIGVLDLIFLASSGVRTFDPLKGKWFHHMWYSSTNR